MSVLPKELLRALIKKQHFTNTDDVLNLLKEMFKHVVCIESFEDKAPFTNSKTIDWLNATSMTGFINAICH